MPQFHYPSAKPLIISSLPVSAELYNDPALFFDRLVAVILNQIYAGFTEEFFLQRDIKNLRYDVTYNLRGKEYVFAYIEGDFIRRRKSPTMHLGISPILNKPDGHNPGAVGFYITDNGAESKHSIVGATILSKMGPKEITIPNSGSKRVMEITFSPDEPIRFTMFSGSNAVVPNYYEKKTPRTVVDMGSGTSKTAIGIARAGAAAGEPVKIDIGPFTSAKVTTATTASDSPSLTKDEIEKAMGILNIEQEHIIRAIQGDWEGISEKINSKIKKKRPKLKGYMTSKDLLKLKKELR